MNTPTGRRRLRTHRTRAGTDTPTQPPWQTVVNPLPPIEVLSADQIEAIHLASLRLLEETGMRFLAVEAREVLERAGAEVNHSTQMVRFDRALIEEKLARIPPSFTLLARNPQHKLTIGGNHIAFTSVAGPAYCSDLDRGRRPGTYAEMCDYLRLVQSLNVIHIEGGGAFEPMDLPPNSRHLDVCLAQIRLLDKNWKPIVLGRERATDAIDMACIAYRTDRRGLAREPTLLAVINTNSPLLLDVPMAEAAMVMAAAGQPVCITPFTLAGAMSPLTLAGALAQQNAEVLAGLTLVQSVNPGAPSVYGGFTSNVDMRSGSPAFGTPEYTKAAQASGQLARRYGIPFRSSNTNTSNCLDAQAAYESEMSIWGAITGHANILNHGAGWLEGGLTASFEKLIVDAEMLQMMVEYLKPLEVNDETLALDVIQDVGPGGHFFGTAHTLARYQNAFYEPLVSDRSNFERWREAGSLTVAERANVFWKQLLSEYQQPSLDPGIDEELTAFVAQRKEKLARAL